MTDACREAFEKFCRDNDRVDFQRYGDTYMSVGQHWNWTLWQAAWNTRAVEDAEAVGVVQLGAMSGVAWTERGASLLVGTKLYTHPPRDTSAEDV